MANWRLLEAEIVDILRLDGIEVTESQQGEKYIVTACGCNDLSITGFAQALADRVELKSKAVQVKVDRT